MDYGTIRSLKLEKGFGFICRPYARDVFFHHSDLMPPLEFDEQLRERRVTFTVIESEKGDRAKAIKAAD